MRFRNKKYTYGINNRAELAKFGIYFITNYRRHRIRSHAATRFSPNEDCDRPIYYRFGIYVKYFLNLDDEIKRLQNIANDI